MLLTGQSQVGSQTCRQIGHAGWEASAHRSCKHHLHLVCGCSSSQGGDASNLHSRFASSSAPQDRPHSEAVPGSSGDASSGKKVGLMQRLLNKAKPHHKLDSKHFAQQSEPQPEHHHDACNKPSVRRVSIAADDSKENVPASGSMSSAEQLQQSKLGSSLPLTPAFEGQIPTRIRRSSIPPDEDHHLQAFENSAPGRIALAVAPQLADTKGTVLHSSCYHTLLQLVSTSCVPPPHSSSILADLYSAQPRCDYCWGHAKSAI